MKIERIQLKALRLIFVKCELPKWNCGDRFRLERIRNKSFREIKDIKHAIGKDVQLMQFKGIDIARRGYRHRIQDIDIERR